MARSIQPLLADPDQIRALKVIVRRTSSPQRMVLRARIVLSRVGGVSQQQTADLVGVQRVVVGKWEKRFRDGGVEGLVELKRSGRPPSLPEETKARILSEAVRPPAGRARWSTRTMAKAKGVSSATVHRLWNANDIKPHLVRTFKLSNDKDFEPKFWDVIGLYLDPPGKALVFCCDEKSQCQALERTQPGLPLGVGHIRTATHDYVRHGTLTLFAALNYLDGRIIRRTAARHTHAEWLAFLKQIDKETPDGLALHLVVDNYSTHKHPKVKSWIQWRNRRHAGKHGVARIVLHFTPTSSSWMNLVERFFRDLTEDAIRDGSFTSLKELEEAIEAYLADRDANPRRYVWKAKGSEILAKIHRARAAMATTHD